MKKIKNILPFQEFGEYTLWKNSSRILESVDTQNDPSLEEVKEDVDRCLAKIVGKFPFFGAFVYRFRILYVNPNDRDIQTMATDGKNIFINPKFAMSLTYDQMVFILCHEILHNVMVHFMREQNKGITDHRRWNIAADYEINPMLVDEGILTASEVKNDIRGLYSEKYLGMSAEEIYDEIGGQNMPTPPLPEDKPDSGDSESDGGGDGGSDSGGESGGDGGGDSGGESLPKVGDKVLLNDGSEAVVKQVYPNGDIEI
jgi:uncharacterized membrane protein YgcG